MNSNKILANNINNIIEKLNILKNDLSLLHNEQKQLSTEKFCDIQELLGLIDTNIDVSLYKIDKDLPITNKTIKDRIKEYEIEKKTLEPFLPSLLIYHMLVSATQ